MFKTSLMHCIICNSQSLTALPNPHPKYAITTSGFIIDEPLGKHICNQCGAVFRQPFKSITKASIYKQNYKLYFSRPNAKKWDSNRYKEMAQWVKNTLKEFSPKSVTDVGCGQGWMMDAIKKVYPETTIKGIDPSFDNSRIARERGLNVSSGMLSEVLCNDLKSDLIISTNVLQHVDDPLNFLRDKATLLKANSRLVIICPDSVVPSNELLWVDHSLSLMKCHVLYLAAQTGLSLVAWDKWPKMGALLDKQIFVFKKAQSSTPLELKKVSQKFIQERVDYLNNWAILSERLKTIALEANGDVYNFGASMWTMLLSAYSPVYWENTVACVIDQGSGEFLSRPVIKPQKMASSKSTKLVLGIAPYSQRLIYDRFKVEWPGEVVYWHDLITR